MSKICDICGKRPHSGNRIVRRGLAKKKGGIGLNITGVVRRRFLPNLQKVRTVSEGGGVQRQRVCTSCLKAGKIVKA